ncbi:MAG TPA: tetratricopeptide repeat protein [Chthoniobacterales bacterium]
MSEPDQRGSTGPGKGWFAVLIGAIATIIVGAMANPDGAWKLWTFIRGGPSPTALVAALPSPTPSSTPTATPSVDLLRDANAGNRDAMRDLGHWYYYDRSDGHYEKAVQWYQKAAGAGSAVAMNNLGGCYEEGTGVRKDRNLARQWYHAAVAAGYTHAQEALARLGP